MHFYIKSQSTEVGYSAVTFLTPNLSFKSPFIENGRAKTQRACKQEIKKKNVSRNRSYPK